LAFSPEGTSPSLQQKTVSLIHLPCLSPVHHTAARPPAPQRFRGQAPPPSALSPGDPPFPKKQFPPRNLTNVHVAPTRWVLRAACIARRASLRKSGFRISPGLKVNVVDPPSTESPGPRRWVWLTIPVRFPLYSLFLRRFPLFLVWVLISRVKASPILRFFKFLSSAPAPVRNHVLRCKVDF